VRYTNLYNAIEEVGQTMVDRIRGRLIADQTVANKGSGGLLESIKYSRQGTKLTISANSYFDAVDKGLPPGQMPDVADIERWVKNKKIQPRDRSGRFIQSTDRTIGRLSKNIANAIAEKGTIKRFNYGGSGIKAAVVKSQSTKIANKIKAALLEDVRIELQKIKK